MTRSQTNLEQIFETQIRTLALLGDSRSMRSEESAIYETRSRGSLL
jgi:hypothetical protein